MSERKRLSETKTSEMHASDAASPTMKELRDAIPARCFRASNIRSFAYIIRDLFLVCVLVALSSYISEFESLAVRTVLWTAYGIAQGMVMTGIWILAHECGHQALFSNQLTNDSLGFILHSMLLVPYFSWKYSHGLHHRYTNHMEKDTAFVPHRKTDPKNGAGAAWLNLLHSTEDAPVLNLALLCLHQLFGFPAYLLFNVSAGMKSLQQGDRVGSGRQSHFDPAGHIFTVKQHPFILLSDVGLALVLFGVYQIGVSMGFGTMLLLYVVPYLWMNHWIVAITYLHHTHPKAAHFEAETWTFRDGALSTVDRDFGWIGKHIFHGIIEFHVVHHLFARVPFYHAEEATEAISAVLGDKYLCVKTSFLADLWHTFSSCRFVEASEKAKGILHWNTI